MPRKLTLDALRVLDAIDHHGSFSAAAQALHRVPSKITYTVKSLEQELEIKLFRRVGRKSVLTPAGLTLLEEGRQLLQAADLMVEEGRMGFVVILRGGVMSRSSTSTLSE